MNIIKQKQTHRYREQTSGYQLEEGRDKMGRRLRDTIMNKIKNNDILYSTGKYNHCFVITLNGI